MVFVKVIFMLIGLSGAISLLMPGSPSRNNLRDHVRVRRGFRSYFYNYLDEIAMATCTAIPSNGSGVVYAVRRRSLKEAFNRTCGEKPDCKHICTEERLRQQAASETRNLTWDCIESLHVYKRRPALADNYDEDTDSHKLGLAVFRHYSCTVSGCGPNYCCCRAVDCKLAMATMENFLKTATLHKRKTPFERIT